MTKPEFPESLLDFQRMFRDEDSCLAYMERVRFPEGFVCGRCAYHGESWRIATMPGFLRCPKCRWGTSMTAGTIMHRSKQPLHVWFWAAYLVTTQTPGMSALQFQRQLGITRYETAFQLLHKLRAAMVRPDRDKIGDEWPVEIDEVFIGGATRGHGRGVHYKAIVAGAVEVRSTKRTTSASGKALPIKRLRYAGRLRLQVVDSRAQVDLDAFVKKNVTPGALIHTDGWTGYDHLAGLGYRHEPIVMRGDPERAEKYLPMIHLVFSNLKTWIMGTHHGVSQQHLQAYLNEYVFRFNRRFYPMTSFASVLGIGSVTEGPTYQGLYGGERQPQKTPRRSHG